MKPRERVWAVLQGQIPDRVPRFEPWIDGLLVELGEPDPIAIYPHLGQDCVLLPGGRLPGSNAWRSGADEWGCRWQEGTYVGGLVDTWDDLDRYSPAIKLAARAFDETQTESARARFPDHCYSFGTHIGPFTAAYMAMGMEAFFLRLADDPAFVQELLQRRTDWAIAVYQQALMLGAEVLILGDDVAARQGPMISPALYRQLVLPCHKRFVAALDAPVIWHSDGDIRPLLTMAIEAGFVGIHSLEPTAGINLATVKRDYGSDLILIGNLDVEILAHDDLHAVRAEVDRSLAQGSPGGGFMFATCNSIFDGLNAAAVREMFRYSAEKGFY
jgi:uroporphyrinogen decarboxylase